MMSFRNHDKREKKAEKKSWWRLIIRTMWGDVELKRSQTVTLTMPEETDKGNPPSGSVLPPAELN